MRSKKDNESLEAVHSWVLKTMKKKGWSARYWAIEAGVGASTLQRFIKEKPWCLSATTIGLLGAKAGSYPFENPKEVGMTTKTIALMEIKGKEMRETEQTIRTTERISDKAFAVPVAWNTMDDAGRQSIYPGDIIVVEPNKKPSKGQVVMIKNRDSFSIYEYQHPYLLPRSTNQKTQIDVALVDILGVVVQVIRDM